MIPSISVVMPTYRRPELLRLCLASLLKQSHVALEICIGRRAGDIESAQVIAEFASKSDGKVRDVVVGESDNLVASMNASLDVTTGELIALTDDDAEFPPNWLEKLGESFADPAIGGVGGRDWQPVERWDEMEVGMLRWWGKVIGNHHLGSGNARDVDLLKGVNCCFRGDLLRLIRLDRRLRGKGNVSHWEMHLCFALRRAGWRLVYDPSISVIHHIGARLDGDVNARGGFASESYVDGVHNGMLAILEHLSKPRCIVFLLWQFCVGTRAEPGLIQVPRSLLRGATFVKALQRFVLTQKGLAMAFDTWQQTLKKPNIGPILPQAVPATKNAPNSASGDKS